MTPQHPSATRFAVRAYRVTNEQMVNRTDGELEAMPREARVFVSRIRRGGAIIEPTPSTSIQKDDVVAVMTRAELLMACGTVIGPNPLVLLGACTGAGTVTAALRALEEESQSKLPVLGYTVPYAVGNILLTALGPVIVAMMR